MIKAELEEAINGQINQEFTAGYAYLGMAAYFDQDDLSGFAHWCQLQYEEELQHAMRLFQYLIDRGGKIQLDAIASPKSDYASPLEVFETALAQEEENTKSINELYHKAAELSDHATISHLQWFLDEQVEEEKTVSEVISLVKRAGDDANALLYLNDKLGARPPESAESAP